MKAYMQPCRSHVRFQPAFQQGGPFSFPKQKRSMRASSTPEDKQANPQMRWAFGPEQLKSVKKMMEERHERPYSWGMDLSSEQVQRYRDLAKEFMVANSKSSEAESEEEPVPPQPHSVAADLEETEDGYDLFIDTPGIQKSDAKINVNPERRVMTVTWKRERTTRDRVTKDGLPNSTWIKGKYERHMGEFKRVVYLARNCDASTIKAALKNGVLHITAKKRLPAREVEIN